ncbi:phosphatidylcholine/phosphatidylserine synthase [Halorubellus sp. JP-L1]|uniref:protein sorting system archaetidylserine synthase n=1 Tax=Halorubellus sp. JP-L1 TaxID=2715753 RepID=UPI001409C30E|nr:protein sorting system archaetidylserine synthase [Halorubellus sp. JP-L1]NHN40114.1 phosphatidylcholine/phosphatidylserine synthase [Halorubellus sp. JP-L1]
MLPRFVGRLSLADAVTTANASLGFVAVVTAFADPALAARVVLLAGIADGLDGVVARYSGGSAAGPYLDSLADVASFCVAPAVVVYVTVTDAWGISVANPEPLLAVALVVPALFVAMGVVRLGLYTAHDTADDYTEGVQTTLAATILAAAVLSGVTDPRVLVVATAAFVYLMVSTVRYPDLLARDALLMGIVHALAVLVPHAFGRTFPWAILTLGVAYLLGGPWFYWRDDDQPTPNLYGNA